MDSLCSSQVYEVEVIFTTQLWNKVLEILWYHSPVGYFTNSVLKCIWRNCDLYTQLFVCFNAKSKSHKKKKRKKTIASAALTWIYKQLEGHWIRSKGKSWYKVNLFLRKEGFYHLDPAQDWKRDLLMYLWWRFCIWLYINKVVSFLDCYILR